MLLINNAPSNWQLRRRSERCVLKKLKGFFSKSAIDLKIMLHCTTIINIFTIFVVPSQSHQAFHCLSTVIFPVTETVVKICPISQYTKSLLSFFINRFQRKSAEILDLIIASSSIVSQQRKHFLLLKLLTCFFRLKHFFCRFKTFLFWAKVI